MEERDKREKKSSSLGSRSKSAKGSNDIASKSDSSSDREGKRKKDEVKHEEKDLKKREHDPLPEGTHHLPLEEYTFGGVIAFLSKEARRFDLEKELWNYEKGTLMSRIQVLEKEKHFEQQLRADLVKRVKMLEYLLQQERGKRSPKEGTVSEEQNQQTTPTKTQEAIPATHDTFATQQERILKTTQRRDMLKKFLSDFEDLDNLYKVPEFSFPVALPKIAAKTSALSQNLSNSAVSAPNSSASVQSPSSAMSAYFADLLSPASESPKKKEPSALETTASSPIVEKGPSAVTTATIGKKSKSSSKIEQDLTNIKSDFMKESHSDPNIQNHVQEWKSWKIRTSLKHHLDNVRSIVFHNKHQILLSASDDSSIKLWNLKYLPTKGSSSVEVEPLYTYYSHVGPVLSLAIDSERNKFFSGGLDKQIIVWRLNPNEEPFAKHLKGTPYLEHASICHDDAIWDLRQHTSAPLLFSASADCSVKVWNYETENEFKVQSKILYPNPDKPIVPTSIDMIHDDPNKMVISYDEPSISLYDIETNHFISTIKQDLNDQTLINKVVSHPVNSLIISAHENKLIRLWDYKSGKCIQTINAHLDAVSSLAVPSEGKYFLSSGHDSSLRFWDLNTFSLLQEINSHKKKWGESIESICFHSGRSLLASAGSDSVVKTFSQSA